MLPAECRTHVIYPDVTLSCCGAGYGEQDVPLAVDLPGSREQPRCYFIADGREDPYGQAPYESGPAKHRKALHLSPFWAGAQRTCDAVGLALYRDKDWSAPQVLRLQSHFVLRRGDSVWLGNDRLPLAPLPCSPAPLPSRSDSPVIGNALPSPLTTRHSPLTTHHSPLTTRHSPLLTCSNSLAVRYGTAAVGVRLLWARTIDGQPAPATLIDDCSTVGCLRISVDHARRPRSEQSGTPGVAFWVRVGSGLATDADFDAWRKRFQAARPQTVRFTAAQTCIEVPGQDGPLRISVQPPLDRGGRVQLCPKPCRGPIELDSQEIGRPLLAAVEPLRSAPPGANPLEPIRLPPRKPITWPAASGLVLPGMAAFADPTASAGRCVCQPAGPIAGPNGSVSWLLDVPRAGRYWLWARLRAPDGQPHSFYVSLLDGGRLAGPQPHLATAPLPRLAVAAAAAAGRTRPVGPRSARRPLPPALPHPPARRGPGSPDAQPQRLGSAVVVGCRLSVVSLRRSGPNPKPKTKDQNPGEERRQRVPGAFTPLPGEAGNRPGVDAGFGDSARSFPQNPIMMSAAFTRLLPPERQEPAEPG